MEVDEAPARGMDRGAALEVVDRFPSTILSSKKAWASTSHPNEHPPEAAPVPSVPVSTREVKSTGQPRHGRLVSRPLLRKEAESRRIRVTWAKRMFKTEVPAHSAIQIPTTAMTTRHPLSMGILSLGGDQSSAKMSWLTLRLI